MQQTDVRDIETTGIHPSPYQPRYQIRNLDALATSIADIGIINPITVREVAGHYEIVAGERRWRAAQQLGLATIPAIVKILTDSQARRLAYAENVQRDDLSPIEEVAGWVGHLDAQLWQNGLYRQYAETNGWPTESDKAQEQLRVRWLLMKLDADRRNGTDYFTHKFVGKINELFSRHHRNIDWRSFLNHDIPLLDLPEPVREAAIEHGLNKSQAKALGQIAQKEPAITGEILRHAAVTVETTNEHGLSVFESVPLIEASAREIKSSPAARRQQAAIARREDIDRLRLKPELESSAARYTVQVGQTWRCGRHTVICGDAYQLIAQIQADALITDPPYGIDYAPDWNKWAGSPSNFDRITGDNEPFDPAPLMNFPTMLLFGANYYSNRLPLGGWLCWDKRTDERLDSMFGSPFELAWYSSPHTSQRAIMIRLLHGGVINADSKTGNNEPRYHPTQKPIALMIDIIEKLTRPGEIILDPFAGSGSTLLACERLGMTCVAIEIEPDHTATILERYRTETGAEPCLV